MSTDYLTTADLSAVYLPSYSFASANCRPVYRRSANLCPLTSRLLPTCLPPICIAIIIYMPRADLSTVDMSNVSLSSYPFYLPAAYRRSVHLRPLTTCLLPTCLPPICPPMSTEYLSTADLSTADLSTYVHLHGVWSRTLIYWASIQENCLGATSTNTTLLIFGNFRSFP